MTATRNNAEALFGMTHDGLVKIVITSTDGTTPEIMLKLAPETARAYASALMHMADILDWGPHAVAAEKT